MDFINMPAPERLKYMFRVINAALGIRLDAMDIPLNDAATLQLFRNGDTEGIFQFGMPGMRKYLQELKPEGILDLAGLIFLYRPGCIQYVSHFIRNRKQGLPTDFTIHDLPAMTISHLFLLIHHTLIAWKMAYLKAHYGFKFKHLFY